MADEEFDDHFAAELLGTHILAGVTYVDRSGNVTRQIQFHGRVTKANPIDGVTVTDASGKEHRLPPYRGAYVPAEPGDYRLRSSGEVVVDPDYLTTWTVHPREEH